MTEWKIVQGSQTERPAEWDAASSPTTVYQRRNVERVTVEDEDGTTTELWRYDERAMTREDYAGLRFAGHEAAEADLDALAVDHELRLSLLELGVEGGEF